MKEKDWSNIRVGHVVVKELDEQYVTKCEERIKNGELKRYNKKWICKCDCGKTISISSTQFKKNKELSCGCVSTKYFAKDLVGKKFNKWVVLERDYSDVSRTRWFCRCECGGIFSVQGTHLRSGASRMCKSCSRKERFYKERYRLIGKQFGDLIILDLDDEKTYRSNDKRNRIHAFYICKCKCGNIESVESYKLTEKGTKMCSVCESHGFKNKKSFEMYKRNLKNIGQNGSLLELFLKRYSLAQIDKMWSSKNYLSPAEFTMKSHQQIYLICPCCGNEYTTNALQLYSRVSDVCCPSCGRIVYESFLEKATREFLQNQLYLDTLHEGDCNLIVYNPKTKCRLLYDNEIVGKKIIIEVMGSQHYELLPIGHRWLGGKTPQEFLDDLQWKDALKKDFAIQQGYKYLALSYKDFEDDTFRNKIEEVVL